MILKKIVLLALMVPNLFLAIDGKYFPIEDSCKSCLSSTKMAFCLGLFRQACVGTTEDIAHKVYISQDLKDQLLQDSSLKAARKTRDNAEYLKLLDCLYKKSISDFVKTKTDRIELYYANLISDAKDRESKALSRGFYVPSSSLSETTCNDMRLILGDNGSALNSILNIVFTKISPTKTTFGYVAAIDAIVSPTDDIKSLQLFQGKLKKLVADRCLLDQLKVLLNKIAKLEHAYFYLFNMPKAVYDPKLYESSHSKWQEKVESRTFDLAQWGNEGSLSTFGIKDPRIFQAKCLITNAGPSVLYFGGAVVAILFIIKNGVGELLIDYIKKLHFPSSNRRDELFLRSIKDGETMFSYCFDKDVTKPVGQWASNWLSTLLWGATPFLFLIKNPSLQDSSNAIKSAFNKFLVVIWARNLCVDIKNFLKFAIEIEKKAFYVGIGDGKSIYDSIYNAVDPDLAACLSRLMDERDFNSKGSVRSPSGLMFNFSKTIYILVYLTSKNREFMTDIARRVGEIDYAVATANLVASTQGQENGFNFVQYVDSEKAVVDCRGTWNLFVDPTQAVANDISFGIDKDSGVFVNGYLLTGGNGVGKSCFSSSFVASVVLGQTATVAPVKSLKFAPYKEILTYVKVDADPTKGRSLFVSQMHNVGKMAGLAELSAKDNKKVLLFMDESLSGTRWTIGTAISQALITKCFMGKENVSLIFATHLDLIARTCNKRSGGSILPIKIACQTSPEGRFVRSLYKVVPGVCINDTAFSIAEDQWSEYGFCKEVVQAAMKEYAALAPIEEYAKSLAPGIPVF